MAHTVETALTIEGQRATLVMDLMHPDGGLFSEALFAGQGTTKELLEDFE